MRVRCSYVTGQQLIKMCSFLSFISRESIQSLINPSGNVGHARKTPLINTTHRHTHSIHHHHHHHHYTSCPRGKSNQLISTTTYQPHRGRPDSTIHRITRSYCIPLTLPPPIDVLTLRLNASRFCLRSSAASLFSGSEAFGSRKRN